MSAVFEQPTLWQRVRPMFSGFDGTLVVVVALLAAAGLITMYSAGFDHGTRFVDHGRNMLLAVIIMFVVAQIPPQKLMGLAVPLYAIGVALLVATALFGITKKGATRWLNVGMVIQPSEILKIAMPLMLAWWFQKREGRLHTLDFVIAGLLLLVPVGLVVKQPDLGTSILILSAGLYVIFFAGLSWKLIIPVLALGAAGIFALVISQDALCEPGVAWPMLRDYQKHRVCTLLDPTTDPLGKGFHIIQGMIAIGSGGVTGKGFMNGTQTHLEFIPERTTDFIFAAFGEEFGLLGVVGSLDRLHAADPARPDDRRRGAYGVCAPVGRCRHAELLHLRLRQHGHGEWRAAGGGHPAAVHQLRRHRDGHAGARAWAVDVDRAQPHLDAKLMAAVPAQAAAPETPKFAAPVGVIGVGNMGGAMARRLLDGGCRVWVRDLRPEAEAGAAPGRRATGFRLCRSGAPLSAADRGRGRRSAVR